MDNTAEDIKVLREIAERKQKDQAIGGMVTLLLFALIIGWCAYANNSIEDEKKWCRDASPKEFVAEFETKCAQYRSDPAIKFKIDQILAGKQGWER